MTNGDGISLTGYRDVSRIGSGGLGDVYRATRITTGGSVAIKVVREYADRVATDRRVRRELDVLLRLKGHPNVVQVEELIEFDGGLALVMELVTGGSLMDRLDQTGAMRPEEVATAGIDVARALGDAHALGIVHRDIKPHNVMVGAFGQYKVCDFGIAAVLKDSAATDRTSALSYRYASPEEIADSSEIGAATDVYSLGITLRQILTRETNAARAGAWLDGERTAGRFSEVELGAIDKLVSLVDRMTLQSPDQRPSAIEVSEDLREIESELDATRRRAPDPDATVIRSRTPGPRPEPDVDATVIRPRGGTGPAKPTSDGSIPFALPDPGAAPERWWETH